MKAFLKDNIALAAAIALPLLLAVIFALSTVFVSATVADPKTDFLIATDNNDSVGFRFSVVNDRLTISFQEYKDSNGNVMQYSPNPQLWRVRVPEMSVEEISLNNPNGNRSTAKIDIPGVTDLKMRNISSSPDGYIFVNSYRNGGSNLMTELFAGGGNYRDRYTIALQKQGRTIPVKLPQNNDYYGYNTRFIGWIIEEEGAAR